MKKVAIYICETDSLELLEQQKRQLIELVQFEVSIKFETFIENEFSCKSRKSKMELVARLKRKEFDAVLLYNLASWSNSIIDLILDINELIINGVEFYVFTNNLDLGIESGNVNSPILKAFANFLESNDDVEIKRKPIYDILCGRESSIDEPIPHQIIGEFL